jgi:hypothetical protein
MASQTFSVPAAKKDALVEVNWSRWSYDGLVKVDDEVVVKWNKGKWVPRRVEFEIHGQKAVILRTGWFIEKWLLDFNGLRYK